MVIVHLNQSECWYCYAVLSNFKEMAISLNISIVAIKSQWPHSPILMTGRGGGDPTEVHILYPKKSQLGICLPKKITTFYSVPQKIPLFFFATQKNPGVFHRPKKITFGQNFRPKKITRTPPPPVIKICEWGPWVSNSLVFWIRIN